MLLRTVFSPPNLHFSPSEHNNHTKSITKSLYFGLILRVICKTLLMIAQQQEGNHICPHFVTSWSNLGRFWSPAGDRYTVCVLYCLVLLL